MSMPPTASPSTAIASFGFVRACSSHAAGSAMCSISLTYASRAASATTSRSSACQGRNSRLPSARRISRFCVTRGFTVMMEAMAVPPFERFYVEHRDLVFGFLVRRVGRAQAEDAFQETFLRALRGWQTLRHGRHLRAWVLTIAAHVVFDAAKGQPSNSLFQGH